MNLTKIILLLALVSVIGAFTYFALSDAPVEQKQVIKPIANERFFGSS
jgi:hypothetical protein